MIDPMTLPGVKPHYTYLGSIGDTHYYRVPDADPTGPDIVWRLPPDKHWQGVCVWDEWPETPEARQIERQANGAKR